MAVAEAPFSLLQEYIASPNIADLLSEDELGKIGQKVHSEFEVDKQSRADWEEKCDKAMEMAMQIVPSKQYPWPNAANVAYPLMTVAANQFAARAYPALIPGRSVVKGVVVGSDEGQPRIDSVSGQPLMDPETQQPIWEVPPGFKRARAERIASHMSYQLLEEMEEWEPSTDKLLHQLPIIGCVFRKIYYDPLKGRGCTDLVSAKDLVVHYNARSLESAPRATHVLDLYPYEITEKQRAGLFLEQEYGPSEGEDEDAPHIFLEQHRWLDLDDDGYPEPYVVTVHEQTSQVARIVARFGEEDVEYRNGEVLKITPFNYFTKFPFLPSADGSFYDAGFGTILLPLNNVVNSTINQLIDAGTLQNTGGGFIGRGLKIKSGELRFRPGEWKPATVGIGGTIRDNVFPIPAPGPSPVLFQLLGLMIEAGKDITSVQDIMTGDAESRETATTTMARVEQGLKVFTGIYKRLFRAQKEELRKLYKLNRQYLAQETYYTVMDSPQAIAKRDYAAEDIDVVPVSDPGMASDLQKMAKAQFLMLFAQDPFFDPMELRRRLLEASGIESIDRLLIQPKPDPELAAKADEMDIKKKEVGLKEGKLQLDAAKLTGDQQQQKAVTTKILAEAEAKKAEPVLRALEIRANREKNADG